MSQRQAVAKESDCCSSTTGALLSMKSRKNPGVRHLGPPVATVITLVCLATFWQGLLSKRKGQSTFFRQKHQEECIWPSCEASRSTQSVPRHSNSALTSRCQSVRHLGRGAYPFPEVNLPEWVSGQPVMNTTAVETSPSAALLNWAKSGMTRFSGI